MLIQFYALVLGLLCHISFVFSVSLMAVSIFFGLDCPLYDLKPTYPFLWNFMLLLQFPILHSLLLSKRGGKILDTLSFAPRRSDLRTTLFTLIASLQLIAVFAFWSPSHLLLWQWPPKITILCTVFYVFSWLLLARSMFEAGLSSQIGFNGWSAVFRRRKPSYPTFPSQGLHAVSRHPIYLSFSLILWAAPRWTADHLFLASLWTLYCLAAPKLKELRYRARYGQQYTQYISQTPYLLPRMPALASIARITHPFRKARLRDKS